MTPEQLKQIKKLLNLADAAADLDLVDVHLVSLFHTLREELGLAKLLLLIQSYVEQQSRSNTEIPKVSQQNQNSNVV